MGGRGQHKLHFNSSVEGLSRHFLSCALVMTQHAVLGKFCSPFLYSRIQGPVEPVTDQRYVTML